MGSDGAIIVGLLRDDVFVRFSVLKESSRSLRRTALSNMAGGRVNKSADTIQVEALSGIPLNVKRGARVGFIGHNSAGKSTLWRMMASIYPSTQGSVHHQGRLSPLIDIALGVDQRQWLKEHPS